MHETSIVQSLLKQIAQMAEGQSVHRVKSIRLRIGELSGVDISLFETAFDAMKRNTICRDAVIDAVSVKARWTCKDCGKEISEGKALQCSECKSPSVLLEGTELILESVQWEVA